MDANLVTVLNRYRRQSGFELFPEVPEFIVYAMQLGLGRGITSETVALDPADGGSR